MEKKIIALALALVLMVTVFAGCSSKKRETSEINGKDYILATDTDGNTIINEENQIVAVVTDKNGEVITYENGEDQTYHVQLDGSMAIDGVARSDKYSINVPEGWSVLPNGRIAKDKTDDKCYIQFTEIGKFEKDENLDTYLANIDEQDKQLAGALEKEGYKLTVDKSEAVLNSGSLHCKVYTYKVVDADGKVVHYAEQCYFTSDGAGYILGYACLDGVGYDESFDFKAFATSNFTFKE